MVDALAKSLSTGPEPMQDDLRASSEWYEHNRERLAERYPNEYIAIVDDEVIDHDTGADCSLVPLGVARQLDVPRVGALDVQGVGGGHATAPVHAASVEIANLRILVRLVALENELTLGRDTLNRLKLLLDGPRLRVRL